MIRNDYKRSLILLRCNAPGYSGHVRLERRTLMGSMYFVAQSANENERLQAVLIGRDKNGYYACGLGEMRGDGRQYSLSAAFDPRNICNRELEQYQLAAVVRQETDGCRIVLFGNLNGHAEIDWERASEAACGLFAGSASVLDLAEEAPARAERPEVPQIQAEPEIIEETPPVNTAGTAYELLEIDESLPWPDGMENLRDLFRASPALEIAPDGDYVYISAPMPAESGYESCAVGLRMQNGRVASVRYALPALYSAEPPAGLEDYSWAGDNSRGWWMTDEIVVN